MVKLDTNELQQLSFFNCISCRYILSIGNAGEIQEYMLELLDGSDPRVRTFISQLIQKWRPQEKPPDNITVSSFYWVI